MAQAKKGKTASGSAARVKKEAKKALARARKSVKSAREAVARSSAKLRKEAHTLSKQTQKLAAKHEKAAGKLAAAAAARARAQPTPVKKVSPPGRPPAEFPQPTQPTLAELRRRARERKLSGYSRLNKADLLAKLDSAQS